MDEQKRQPKISLPEAIFIGLFVAFLDILDLIPFVGDVTTVIAAPVMLYLFMKGVNGTLFLISEVLDLIPGIQEFPTRSIAWWVTVGIDHFAPAKVAELAEKTGQALEGGGEEDLAVAGGGAAGARTTGAEVAGGTKETDAAGKTVSGGAEESTAVHGDESGGMAGTDEEKQRKDSEIDKEMASKTEREPGEVLQEELLGDEPLAEENDEDDQEELPAAA